MDIGTSISPSTLCVLFLVLSGYCFCLVLDLNTNRAIKYVEFFPTYCTLGAPGFVKILKLADTVCVHGEVHSVVTSGRQEA